jgi:hypothetical protein
MVLFYKNDDPNNKEDLLNKKYFRKRYRPIPPDVFISLNELPKIALLETIEKGKASEIIVEFIEKNRTNIYDIDFIEKIKTELNFDKLDKMFFDERLKVIPEYINKTEKKAKLNEVLAKHGLNAKQIPSKILAHWLNIQEVKKDYNFKNRIKAERKDCKQKLKDLDKGKVPKIGEMATFLARDIVKLVINKDTKKKITSYYYNLMQECLALYVDPAKKELFEKLCDKELNLFDKKTGHPFLSDINLNTSVKTKDLYKEYLTLKGAKKGESVPDDWLYKTFYRPDSNKKETTISMPQDTSLVPVYYENKEKSNLETWLNNVRKDEKNPNRNPKPIDLPTNLFDEELNKLLKQKIKNKLDENKKYNFSKLLALWQNHTQPFYNERRHYTIFKGKPYEANVEFNPNENREFSSYYSRAITNTLRERRLANPKIKEDQIKQVFKKAIDENEKRIRFYQTKDRITLLMLNDLISEDLNISLNEISPGASQNPLDVSIKVRQKVCNKTIVGERKRKDFSVFRKLVSDRRLPALFEYYDSDTIAYEKLRAELDDYNRYKEKVFKMIFDLEEAIINVITDEELAEILKKEKINNLQHRPYLEWLKSYNIIDDTEMKFLGEIRNKFSHNEFPSKSVIEEYTISLNEEQTLSSQIVTKYLEFVERLIKENF